MVGSVKRKQEGCINVINGVGTVEWVKEWVVVGVGGLSKQTGRENEGKRGLG